MTTALEHRSAEVANGLAPPPRRFLPALEGMRGVAALTVFVYQFHHVPALGHVYVDGLGLDLVFGDIAFSLFAFILADLISSAQRNHAKGVFAAPVAKGSGG